MAATIATDHTDIIRVNSIAQLYHTNSVCQEYICRLADYPHRGWMCKIQMGRPLAIRVKIHPFGIFRGLSIVSVVKCVGE